MQTKLQQASAGRLTAASKWSWALHRSESASLDFSVFGTVLIDFHFLLSNSTLAGGAGFTHILHKIQHNNFAPGNAGIILYWDFLFPIVMLVIYLLITREQNKIPG